MLHIARKHHNVLDAYLILYFSPPSEHPSCSTKWRWSGVRSGHELSKALAFLLIAIPIGGAT